MIVFCLLCDTNNFYHSDDYRVAGRILENPENWKENFLIGFLLLHISWSFGWYGEEFSQIFYSYLHRRMDGLSWVVQPANIEHLVKKTFIKYSTKLCVYSIIFDKIWQLTKKVPNNNLQIFSEVRIFTINFRLLTEFRNGLQNPLKEI